MLGLNPALRYDGMGLPLETAPALHTLRDEPQLCARQNWVDDTIAAVETSGFDTWTVGALETFPNLR